MNEWSDETIRKALKAAFPPPSRLEPLRDLWPVLRERLDAPAQPVAWLDWAVVAVSAGLLLFLPGIAPILFYFL